MTHLDEDSDINEDGVLVIDLNRDLTDDESEDVSEDESVVEEKSRKKRKIFHKDQSFTPLSVSFEENKGNNILNC